MLSENSLLTLVLTSVCYNVTVHDLNQTFVTENGTFLGLLQLEFHTMSLTVLNPNNISCAKNSFLYRKFYLTNEFKILTCQMARELFSMHFVCCSLHEDICSI